MKLFALLLSSLLALNPLWAQQTNSAAETPAADPQLRVRLVDDPGPAQPQSTSAKGFIFQVTSASGAPVNDAAVALRLPEEGSTGRFSNGLSAWVAYSDSSGLAHFPAITWAAVSGAVQLKVTAVKGTSHVAIMLVQTVSSSPAPSVTAAPVVAAKVAQPAPPPAPVLTAADLPPLNLNFQPLADIPSALPPPLPVAPQPGQPGNDMNISHSGSSPDSPKPHALVPNPPAPAHSASDEPKVSIVTSPSGANGSGPSHKKMWIWIGVGAGAAAAAAVAMMAMHGGGGGGSSSGSGAGLTIGAPTVSVGHPPN